MWSIAKWTIKKKLSHKRILILSHSNGFLYGIAQILESAVDNCLSETDASVFHCEVI